MDCCPTAVIGALASQTGAQLLYLRGIENLGVQDSAAGHLVDSKMFVLPPLLSIRHMAMNADLLAPAIVSFTCKAPQGNVCLPLLWASHLCWSVSPSRTSAQVPQLPRGVAHLPHCLRRLSCFQPWSVPTAYRQHLSEFRGNVSALGARQASFWTRAPPVAF